MVHLNAFMGFFSPFHLYCKLIGSVLDTHIKTISSKVKLGILRLFHQK